MHVSSRGKVLKLLFQLCPQTTITIIGEEVGLNDSTISLPSGTGTGTNPSASKLSTPHGSRVLKHDYLSGISGSVAQNWQLPQRTYLEGQFYTGT